MTELPHPASLAPATLVDNDHPEVIAFAQAHATGQDDRARAIALYYAVRDGFRYDPYRIDLSPHGMQREHRAGPRLRLVRAQGRAAGGGLPRGGHPGTRGLCRRAQPPEHRAHAPGHGQTDLFVWHGYTDIWLDGAWRKATPAFNIELCERFGLLPLDFNGRDDSIYHPFDRAGHRHMEYVAQHGAFDDVPLARIVAAFDRHYPGMQARLSSRPDGNFMDDAAREAASSQTRNPA